MLRSSLVYSGFTLVSRILGFARDLAVSYTMGASATFAADAFNTAWSFPNLFRRIFGEGAFAAAFVPAYARALEKEGEEKADILAGDAMATLAAATVLITVVSILAMPWLMYVVRPGFAAEPAKFNLAVVLTQITMPYLPCMAIYAHLSGVLNARGRFVLSGAAPALLNVWTLITVLPAATPLEAARYATIGVLFAGISQAGVLWWGCKRSGARVHFTLPRFTPEVRHLIVMAVPGAIGASASQINIFISGMLVSQVNGATSWLTYCDRLYQLPQGLIGVAVGVALLPRLSRAIHAGDETGARMAMDEAITFSMALSAPAAAGLVSMPFFLVDALYTRGAFTSVDAFHTAGALLQYGWGVPAFVLAQLLSRAFFARQDTKTPMRYGLVSVAVNIVLGITLYRLVGIPGIAAATATAWWLNVVMMLATLMRRGHYRLSRQTLQQLARIALASTILGAMLGAASHWRNELQEIFCFTQLGPVGPKEFAIAAVVVVAAMMYPVILMLVGGLNPSAVRAALRKK